MLMKMEQNVLKLQKKTNGLGQGKNTVLNNTP